MVVDELYLFVATLLYYVFILIRDIVFVLQLFSLLHCNSNVTVVMMLVCNYLFQLLTATTRRSTAGSTPKRSSSIKDSYTPIE